MAGNLSDDNNADALKLKVVNQDKINTDALNLTIGNQGPTPNPAGKKPSVSVDDDKEKSKEPKEPTKPKMDQVHTKNESSNDPFQDLMHAMAHAAESAVALCKSIFKYTKEMQTYNKDNAEYKLGQAKKARDDWAKAPENDKGNSDCQKKTQELQNDVNLKTIQSAALNANGKLESKACKEAIPAAKEFEKAKKELEKAKEAEVKEKQDAFKNAENKLADSCEKLEKEISEIKGSTKPQPSKPDEVKEEKKEDKVNKQSASKDTLAPGAAPIPLLDPVANALNNQASSPHEVTSSPENNEKSKTMTPTFDHLGTDDSSLNGSTPTNKDAKSLVVPSITPPGNDNSIGLKENKSVSQSPTYKPK